MSTTVEEAYADVEQAKKDSAAAEAELARVNQQIAWGSGNVSAQDLTEKESLVNFAKRRLDGLRAALKRAQNAGAIAAAEADLERIDEASLADAGNLLEAWKAAVLALRALYDLTEQRRQAIREHLETMAEHDRTLAALDAGVTARGLGFSEGFRPTRGSGQLDLGYVIDRDGEYTAVCDLSADRLVALVLESAIPADVWSHIASTSSSDQTILRSLIGRIPGLADVADEIQHPDVPHAFWRAQDTAS